MAFSAAAQVRMPSIPRPPVRGKPDDVTAGRVAHDLRNILQIISGNLMMLASKVGGDESALRHVERAMAGVDLGTRLAGSVLSSQPESGSAGRMCLLSARSTIETLLAEAAGSNVDVTVAMPKSLSSIAVDRTAFENALVNLAINARDAMGKGGKLIVSFADQLCADGRSVVMTATDTGCGMPPEVIDRVFDAYFTTKGINGTGLGLATVKRFADTCGGAISVESAPGRGTTFRLQMPAAG